MLVGVSSWQRGGGAVIQVEYSVTVMVSLYRSRPLGCYRCVRLMS